MSQANTQRYRPEELFKHRNGILAGTEDFLLRYITAEYSGRYEFQRIKYEIRRNDRQVTKTMPDNI